MTSTFQGITHYERTETIPRQLVIHVVEIDLSAPGLSFFTTPGNGALPGETTGQTTSQFVQQYGLQIGINTGFFSSAGIGTNPDGSTAIYRNLSHIAVSDGVGVSPWSGSGDVRESAMNITQNNVATVVRPYSTSVSDYRSRPTNIPLYTTVGGNERLLNGGTVVAADNVLHPRTAIGVNGSKRYLFTVDGRQSGWSLGMTTVEIAHMLNNDYGVTDAVNLDGGGSTTLVMAEPTIRTINRPSDGVQRINGNNLGVRATPWPQWWTDAGGNWGTAGNWTGGVPNGIGAEARLMGAITGNRTITANTPVTLGSLRFASQRSYTVAGANTLTFDTGSGSALIHVASPSASHVVSAPTRLNDDLVIAVDPGAALTLSGVLNNSGKVMSRTGSGALTISGPQSHGPGAMLSAISGVTNLHSDAGAGGANLSLNVSATVNLASTQRLAALNIAPGGSVNLLASGDRTLLTRSLSIDPTAALALANNDLLIDYDGADGSALEAAARQLVDRGRNTGLGITITAASDTILAIVDNADWGRTSFNGIDIDASTIIGKYTFFGDANLDGQVTGDDYVAIDSNLGVGDSWIHGDFNLDGKVTGDDYVTIDANLGLGTASPLAYESFRFEMIAAHAAMYGEPYLAALAETEANGFAVVPEPGSAAALIAACAALLSRRRRRN